MPGEERGSFLLAGVRFLKVEDKSVREARLQVKKQEGRVIG